MISAADGIGIERGEFHGMTRVIRSPSTKTTPFGITEPSPTTTALKRMTFVCAASDVAARIANSAGRLHLRVMSKESGAAPRPNQPPWLRGPMAGVPALLQPVAHALVDAAGRTCQAAIEHDRASRARR